MGTHGLSDYKAIPGRYRIIKEIISIRIFPALIHTRLEGSEDFLKKLHLYVLRSASGDGGWKQR
jgi:hypothetical protein